MGRNAQMLIMIMLDVFNLWLSGPQENWGRVDKPWGAGKRGTWWGGWERAEETGDVLGIP